MAIDSRAKELLSQGDGLFSKKMTVLSLWQEINENFYPERADYTINRYLGQEFASNLSTSYPILVRRKLHSLISGMLRPNEKEWFEISIQREDRLDKPGKQWLEQQTQAMRRAMYDRDANLIRATKECDGDYVTIGNGIIQGGINRRKNALIHHCRHPRDCAWMENVEGKVDVMHRKWKPPVRDAVSLFKSNPDAKMPGKWSSKKDKTSPLDIRHICMPADEYDTGSGPDGKSWKSKYVSIYVDVENGEIILEEPSNVFLYVVPRWQTVSGYQYGFSPCTVAGLPDARLLQAMTLVLLEAGEKAVNPPMIATQDVVRSDINLYAGGTTWVDKDYDERLGAAMKVIEHDISGIPLGDKMREDIKSALREAFFLDTINMPSVTDQKEMTAYEVGQRVQEYVRNALPLFEPMETDYNGALCEMDFALLHQEGAFGSVFDMPASLRKQDINFKFKSSLHDTVEQQRSQTFMQAKALIASAYELDPDAASMIDVTKSLRWALEGMEYPQELQRDDAQMAKISAANAQKAQTAQTVETMNQGGQAANQIAQAATQFKQLQQ